LENFQQLSKALADKGNVLATGVSGTQKWHLAATLLTNSSSLQNSSNSPELSEQTEKSENNRPGLIITHSELSAKAIYEDLYYFFKERCHLYPSRDALFFAADVKSVDITRKRFAIITELLKSEKIDKYSKYDKNDKFDKKAPIIILSAEALLDRLTPCRNFLENIISLGVGDIIEPDTLVRQLYLMGYENRPQVEGPGHFAMRGGILDVYTAAATKGSYALRLEFFGDEIDSIRLLDAFSQRSSDKIERAEIYPMGELSYNDTCLQNAISNITAAYKKSHTSLNRKNLLDEAEALKETIETVLEQLTKDKHCPNIESYFPFFYDTATTLLDYLPSNTILFFDEPNYIATHIETLREEYDNGMKHRLLKGAILPEQTAILLTYEQMLSQAASFDTVLMASMAQRTKGFTPKAIVSFTARACPPLRRKPDELREDISQWKNYSVALLAGSRRNGQQLADSLTEMGISARFNEPLTSLPCGVVTVTRGTLSEGFEYPECKLVVLTDKELFATEKKRKKRRSKDGAKIEHFTDLRPGDYVVHDNHGVGIFKGIEQIVTDGLSRDYLKLAYSDGGHLYVHTGQMELIQKYIGGDTNLKLSKLGGADWAKAKAKARSAVKILAEDLVALYAKRQASKGFVYSTDSVWQTEFEGAFPFDETEDQVNAIEEVKKDMESEKVMDRLICGDVGYGKTEIAIRAAFKAVQDNKQVAYLVPTTILAQQHYSNFVTRMKDYPIIIERLSRFQTAKEQRETLRKLSRGEADIVIGTHRLISKDVSFHNLGLIIIDEEQRFGVSHKEKLKAIRENVDVMTLTATPIPRTLHLSLTGLRDMSLLNEPPSERQPVQTYLMEYNPEFVREAINRELARDGQVYYLHNRVRNIAEETARIRQLVPHAKVAFAHGQMSENELEDVMMAFEDREIQVLVCTTIIETGLDIPNVNTIIIQNADFMGLSQLYQLRGRVGRSNRLAYAYLMYRKDKILEENAEKRLQTIRDFTEFGAGFKIAMRDLEIRGAGNLLGAEQHGHLNSVGYDMYCKLLAEAVGELQGQPPTPSFETTVDLALNAYIPEYFISDEAQKLEIYKKISLIQNNKDKDDVYEEIEDRFGDLPVPVQILLEIALLKAAAHNLGIISIVQKQAKLIITFKGDAPVDLDNLTSLVMKGIALLTMAPNPYLTCHIKEDVMQTLRLVLGHLVGNENTNLGKY